VSEGKKESPDHLVDIVEDEDDGDAGLDVSHVHFAKEALSGRRLLMILGDHLIGNCLLSIVPRLTVL